MTLKHGMLLDSKHVMDNALPELAEIRSLVPEVLHKELDKVLRYFEDTLCRADVSDRYTEVERTR